MLLHRDVLHRDAFTQRCFCTGMLSHTEMPFYAQTFEFQRDYFTLSNFTRRCQNKQRNVCARGAFTPHEFLLLLHDSRRWTRTWCERVQQASICKITDSFTTAFDSRDAFYGKGLAQHKPHCNLTSMYDDGHFVQEGCVSRHQSTLPFRSKKIARL